MRKEQKRALILSRIDPLHEAEQITGKSYKEDESTSLLGFAIQIKKAQDLEQQLMSLDDTTFSNNLSNYLRIVTKFGFEIIYKEPFIDTARNQTENHYILFHDQLSIILSFDTFTWGHEAEANVNGGHIYYNWSPHGGPYYVRGITSSGGYFNESNTPHLTLFEKDFSSTFYIPNYPATPAFDSVNDWNEYTQLCAPIEAEQDRLFKQQLELGKRVIWVGDHDCREALITNIKNLYENGIFVKKWVKCAFPWLTNYMDHKGESKYPFTSHYEKTKQIISKFPLHIQTAIGEYNK